MFLCNRNICLLLILRLKHVVKEKTYWKRLCLFAKAKSIGKKTTQETDDDALGIKKSTKVCQLQTHLNSPFTVFSKLF